MSQNYGGVSGNCTINFQLPYSGKVWRGGKFGESSVIRQTKTIQISTYSY